MMTMTGGTLELAGWGTWWADAIGSTATFNMSGGEVNFTGGPGIMELGWQDAADPLGGSVGIFTGDPADNLDGSFDNGSNDNIFKATFGSSFDALSFGNVAQPGLAQDFLLNDLTVVGSLAGGGALGAVDLVHVPEPSALVLLALGGLLGLTCGWPRSHTER